MVSLPSVLLTTLMALAPQVGAADTLEVVRQLYASADYESALQALDEATRAISAVLDVDDVLQLIADRVRELVGARYAALGIVTDEGRMERFITSGITAEQRAAIGPTPTGHGLLGLLVGD